MENGRWTGRWSVGCAVVFAGFLFLASLWILLFAGDPIGEALLGSGVVAAIALVGAGLFGLLGYRDQLRRRRILAEVRSRLEAREGASDDEACRPVPVEARPFFLEVRSAVSEFFECPPEWLRANDSLEADYRSAELGSVELEWHVFERMRKKLGYGFIHEDLIRDKAAEGTLADLAEYVRELFDKVEPPPAAPEAVDETTNPAP